MIWKSFLATVGTEILDRCELKRLVVLIGDLIAKKTIAQLSNDVQKRIGPRLEEHSMSWAAPALEHKILALQSNTHAIRNLPSPAHRT